VLNVVVNSSQSGADQLFAVGSFDTMTKTSQMQFCSVSTWDGMTFAKVVSDNSSFIDFSTQTTIEFLFRLVKDCALVELTHQYLLVLILLQLATMGISL